MGNVQYLILVCVYVYVCMCVCVCVCVYVCVCVCVCMCVCVCVLCNHNVYCIARKVGGKKLANSAQSKYWQIYFGDCLPSSL